MNILYIDARASFDRRAADEAAGVLELLALKGHDAELLTDYGRALAAAAEKPLRAAFVRVYTADRQSAFAFPAHLRAVLGPALPRLIAVVNPCGGGTTQAEAVAAGFNRGVEVGTDVASLIACLGGDSPAGG